MTWLAASAFVVYLGLGWHFCRTRLSAAAPPRPMLEHGLLLLALALHGLSLWPHLAQSPLHFGAAEALSLTAWLALLIYLLGHLAYRLEGLQPVLLVIVCALLGLSLLLPPGHALTYPQSAVSRLHFLTAMLAYGLFVNAAGVAILMRLADRRLHHADAHVLIRQLPPLLALERLLFACVGVGFAMLSIALITGTVFAEHIYGRTPGIGHKIVFSVAAWLCFAALLLGRHLLGWRGRIATRITLGGCVLLLLGYAGTRFVLETLLRHGA
ncbi:cytochrome C assembly family protein [Jeongeupia chitinilytica]|uniref:Membrane protein n=1 Tax=Jeongeupia chitinilytica TaxID=1041641 RepID=A0ABQ3H468_9NEIS|nr:cytochrome c biogenesis protein CcsA [Jeongeupia chitinilytica]GHD69587.1 membrane protein [Jeongeupia chitinilytica]